MLRKLRAGNFGQLYSCYNKETQKKYAVKIKFYPAELLELENGVLISREFKRV